MHCNLRPPEPRQPFPAWITTPCQVWSRWNYPLLYCSVFAADTLCDLDLWPPWPLPLIFDLEHLQRIACDVMKLCTKFERNQAICRSYCNFSVWPYDLAHCVALALGSGIIFTQVWHFTTYMCLNYSVFWCWYIVTLWPWPFTRWPWKFVVHQTSRDQILYKIWAKSSNPRLK